jgi:pimeloyl-ACP methyl ester carboxylesterase
MLRFMLWGTSTLFASWLPTPLRMRAAKRLRMPVLEDPRVMRLGLYGQLNHRGRLLRPEPLTDEQLRAIEQPLFLVLGEKSEVFPTADVRARAGRLLPRATIEVVEDAGHGVSLSHVEILTGWLAAFLDQQAADANG